MGVSKPNIQIVYILGFGRSGTTLADILVGNIEGYFSCGELNFFALNGIKENEFCSCGNRISDCSFWSSVAAEWNIERKMDLETYIKYFHSYLRNKRFFHFLFRLVFPDRYFRRFLDDTRLLYKIIWKLNGQNIIVDSSKSPYRLLLLRRLGFSIKVVHMIRGIRGVLYSTGKALEKNPQYGVETEITPRSNLHVILTWVFANLLSVIFSIGLKRVVVRFETLLKNPLNVMKSIVTVPPEQEAVFLNLGPFLPGHVVAGGRMRMQKEVWINPSTAKEEVWKGRGIKEMIVKLLDHINWGYRK